MAAWNHVHAAVLHSGVIQSDPATEDARFSQGPAVEILVKPEMAVILWRFGNDMVVPQTNFRRLLKRLGDSSNQRVTHRFFVSLISLPHVDILSKDPGSISGFFDVVAVS